MKKWKKWVVTRYWPASEADEALGPVDTGPPQEWVHWSEVAGSRVSLCGLTIPPRRLHPSWPNCPDCARRHRELFGREMP